LYDGVFGYVVIVVDVEKFVVFDGQKCQDCNGGESQADKVNSGFVF